MQQVKERIKSYMVRGAVTMGAIVLSQIAMMGSAHALTRTWTGGGVNTNFSTVANWGGALPVAGDDLVFPLTTANIAAVNDLAAGTSFNTVTVSGTPAAYQSVDLSGAAFTVAAGITASVTVGGGSFIIGNDVTFSPSQAITTSGKSNISFNGAMVLGASNLTVNDGSIYYITIGVITGSGTITKAGTGSLAFSSASPAFSGSIIANAGTIVVNNVASLGTTAGSTTINAGADISMFLCGASSVTIAENINLNGASSLTTGDNPLPKLTAYNNAKCGGGGGSYDESYGKSMSNGTVTLSGAIVLGSDVTFGSLATTTTLTGALSGAFNISLVPGYGGSLVVNGSSNTTTTANGTLPAAVFSKTISDSVPANTMQILANAIIVLNGTRGAVNISGGTLKGTGTLGDLVLVSGRIAPGLSPGCLNTGNLTFTGGSLDEEIGGTTACSGYDQLKVTGTVALGAATALNVIAYGGFTPAVGNTFTIIDNDGVDAVTGIFQGIVEGGTITVAGTVYRISYVGGTGNDVVATVQSVTATPAVPSAPATGFGLRLENPLAMLVATLLIASSLVMFAYRQFKSR